MSAAYLAAADRLLRTVTPATRGTWPRAGHHHYYELGVTSAELVRLRGELVELLEVLRSRPAPSPETAPRT